MYVLRVNIEFLILVSIFMELCVPLNECKFDIRASPDDKSQYGVVYTPLRLIETMFAMLPHHVFEQPDTRWLDPGAGTGHFSLVLYHRLMQGLEGSIHDKTLRHQHIIDKMIYMVETIPSSVDRLRGLFGRDANIIQGDFTTVSIDKYFDFVVGNPPYNGSGLKKVPTNSVRKKKNDGHTMWVPFVKRSVSLLKPDGRLLFIIPSIWMKPDKAGMYEFMTRLNIERIRCMTNTQTNQMFSGEAQTPTCCVLLRNRVTDGIVGLFDTNRQVYVKYVLRDKIPIPIFGAAIVTKFLSVISRCGSLSVTKTNMPSVGASVSPIPRPEHLYRNIKTCLLRGTEPVVIVNYSNQKLAFAGVPKLILAHKMYGFPYLDVGGEFGISNRDNYVIAGCEIGDLKRIQAFLSTRTALYIFESTRYRMRYLEKYAFDFIPDITKLSDFPEVIDDVSIAQYFGLDDEDTSHIQNLHRKAYSFTPSAQN